MADFKIDFNDSRFSSYSEAKRWADNLVSKIRAMGFSVKEETRNDNVYYTGSKGNMSYEVRLPQKYYGQLYIDIDYKSADAVTSLGGVVSSSGSSSSYTASSSGLTMEDLIMHPAATLASNSKYQPLATAIQEVRRKRPDWEVENTTDPDWITTKIKLPYRGHNFYGGCSYINYSSERQEISSYSYYLEGNNIIQTVVEDIKNLGFAVSEQSSKIVKFSGKGTINLIEVEDLGGWLKIFVQL